MSGMHSTSGPTDLTVDAPLELLESSIHQSRPRCRAMHLVDKTCQQPSLDGSDTLRWRLRVAALTLFLGFALFGVYRVLYFAFSDHPSSGFILTFHLGVTASLALMAGSLWRGCRIGLSWLRVYEVLIFVIPGLFFAVNQVFIFSERAVENQMIPNFTTPWVMLMFTYAIFVPNHWRRAALFLAPCAIVPLAVLILMGIFHPACRAVLAEDFSPLVDYTLIPLIVFIGSLVGVNTIGRLREEANEAQQLGQYQLRELIGSGGMGEVYLGEHQLMKRPCAIKVIRPEKAGDPTVLARFEREVRSTAKLSHWNNIDIYDYGRADDGTFYYVMEYLPGMNLENLVRRFGPLPAERAIFLLRQTCEALTEAHSHGLIHRDIKPANIFAAERGGKHDVAKLLDFGLAKPMQQRSGQPDITQDSSITGSPLYMSPEQATGDREPDARSDIYTLGAVAYFLLSGEPPFNSSRAIRVIISHANESPRPLSEICDVPADLEEVVLKCLAKAPEDRYQSAEDLLFALNQCDAAGGWSFEAAAEWWEKIQSRPISSAVVSAAG